MTKDEIFKLAREIGLTDSDLGECVTDYGDSSKEVERFAALIAAAEREECAKLCKETDDGTPYNLSGLCAAAIRARKNHDQVDSQRTSLRKKHKRTSTAGAAVNAGKTDCAVGQPDR